MSSLRQRLKQTGSLVVFLLLCLGVAATGGLFPPDDWYRSLARPAFAPPNWVFGPVWTVLYLMIAIAGWLAWVSAGATSRDHSRWPAFTAYTIQLLLNGTWSALFFGLHRPEWALVEIGILWLAIATTALLFRRHSTPAAVLLIPYLIWVSFAAVLNYGFWSLN